MGKYLRAQPELRFHHQAGKQPLVEVVNEPMVYVDTDLGVWFEVPVGFVCDGASTPGEWQGYSLLAAGLGHDYLVRLGAMVIDTETSTVRAVRGRREADLGFLGIALTTTGDELLSMASYAALRVAGVVNRYWRRHPVGYRFWLG